MARGKKVLRIIRAVIPNKKQLLVLAEDGRTYSFDFSDTIDSKYMYLKAMLDDERLVIWKSRREPRRRMAITQEKYNKLKTIYPCKRIDMEPKDWIEYLV